MYRWICAVSILLICTTLIAVHSTQAQDEWTWPQKPENLEVLPKDWPGSRLAPVMREFENALGVRCSHCHVGEEGQPLSTYDFATTTIPRIEYGQSECPRHAEGASGVSGERRSVQGWKTRNGHRRDFSRSLIRPLSLARYGRARLRKGQRPGA